MPAERRSRRETGPPERDGMARSTRRSALRPVVLLTPALLSVYGYIRGLFARADPAGGSRTTRIGAGEAERRQPLESPGVAPRPVLGTALGFLVFVGLCLVGLYYYFLTYVSGPLIQPERPFPGPGVRFSADAVERLRAEQHQALTGYAWVDKSQGFVRIPIDRAMQLIAERGAHGLDPLDRPAATPEPGSRGGARP